MSFRNDHDACEAWLAKQCNVVKKDIDYKHRRMKKSPFIFLRATYFRWAKKIGDWCPELMDAPRVLSIGDLHLENFGTWRDACNLLRAFGVPRRFGSPRIPLDRLPLTRNSRFANFDLSPHPPSPEGGLWRTRERGEGEDMNPPPRGADSARAVRELPPRKTEGAGKAGCPMHPQPRVQSVESTRVSHHRSTGATRPSLRNGFNGFLRTPR